MGDVDATCTVCGKAIRWTAGTPRKCAEHKATLTGLEQAKAIVKSTGF